MRLIKRGLYNVVCPTAEWTHHKSLSRGSDDAMAERRERLRKEREHLYDLHPDFFMNDPFFNVNLGQESVYFELDA